MQRLADAWSRHGRTATLLALVVAQAAGILLTWPMWGDRAFPPTLPVVDGLPGLDLGLVLLGTLLGAAFRPRAGTVAHLVVLAAAIVLDQTRMQPAPLSVALLMVAVAFPPLAVVGRAHLAALWFWAGAHKLLSEGYATEAAPFLADGLSLPVDLVRWVAPAMEVALGLLAVPRRTRRVAVALAVVVHVLALATLVRQGWNTAVWPWNAVLPMAAALLLLEEPASREVAADDRGARVLPAWAVAVIWLVAGLHPVGFYLGIADAWTTHNLYTSNTHDGLVCEVDADGVESCASIRQRTYDELNGSVPPETRYYRQWFEAVCEPPQTLVVTPLRTVLTDGDDEVFACPDQAAARPR